MFMNFIMVLAKVLMLLDNKVELNMYGSSKILREKRMYANFSKR